ncbi:hypothetical protein P692DRAFT_20152668 [Suillus brevipes Sb2]|nr:hypothetical protein P692DRAFT_20152668 [Suillus brevipes Sb2]
MLCTPVAVVAVIIFPVLRHCEYCQSEGFVARWWRSIFLVPNRILFKLQKPIAVAPLVPASQKPIDDFLRSPGPSASRFIVG